jgi:hypothetical protein
MPGLLPVMRTAARGVGAAGVEGADGDGIAGGIFRVRV